MLAMRIGVVVLARPMFASYSTIAELAHRSKDVDGVMKPNDACQLRAPTANRKESSTVPLGSITTV